MTTTVLAYIPSPSQGVWHLGPIPTPCVRAVHHLWDRRRAADRRSALGSQGRRTRRHLRHPLWAVPFGLIGGRLYHVMTDWRTYFGDDGAGVIGALRIWDGGLGIWGAVALGGVGAWIGCRQNGIPLPAFGDAIAPGIVLAQAIGRLGNYFNQELYGRPTTLPWGLEIYERRDAGGELDLVERRVDGPVGRGGPSDVPVRIAVECPGFRCADLHRPAIQDRPRSIVRDVCGGLLPWPVLDRADAQ